ncbi:hypothetical protein OIU85_013869, partial [Salix viminalis]
WRNIDQMKIWGKQNQAAQVQAVTLDGVLPSSTRGLPCYCILRGRIDAGNNAVMELS